MDNINTANVTANATTGNLFRECGAGGDATIPGATFMNGVMMEIITAIRNSCQTPVAFDENNPASYSQLWTAITQAGGSCGFEDWVLGTDEDFVRGSDCQYYYAVSSGDPANTQPVGDDGSSWTGPFCSAPKMLSHKMSQCTDVVDVSQSCNELSQMVAVACPTGGFTLGRVAPGASCFGVIFNDVATGAFPLDTDGNSPELYTVDDLSADYAAGTIDQTLLNNSIVSEGQVTVPCGASYNFATTNSVVLTDAYLGTGQFVMSVNGDLLVNAAGQIVYSDVFTNQGGNFAQENWVAYLNAGTHTLRRHYIATADGSGNTAQIRRGTGSVEVCRKDL